MMTKVEQAHREHERLRSEHMPKILAALGAATKEGWPLNDCVAVILSDADEDDLVTVMRRADAVGLTRELGSSPGDHVDVRHVLSEPAVPGMLHILTHALGVATVYGQPVSRTMQRGGEA